MELTDEQETAFIFSTEVLKTKPCFLLYGSAGTGKTTLTKHIAKHFTSLNYPICAIAPTHIQDQKKNCILFTMVKTVVKTYK